MKLPPTIMFLMPLLFLSALSVDTPAQTTLEGDARTACEAILCLSTSKRPEECAPSIKKYFSISFKKPQDTFRARKNFLKLCPAAEQDDNMRRLVDDIVNGAGYCDAITLNRILSALDPDGNVYIQNTLPSTCNNYFHNPYTNIDENPRYVGLPERGGFWCEAEAYWRELYVYNQRIAREDEERRRGGGSGG
jgi:TrbM